MKTTLALSLFGFASCLGHFHEPATIFNSTFDGRSYLPDMHLTLMHQTSLDLDDGNVIILHGLFAPRSQNLFFNEVGCGYRKLGHKFGFGMNFLYSHSNLLKFNAHQVVPGIELFGYHLTLAYNKYIPLQTYRKHKKNQYLYHDVSELCLSYRPSKKYEIGLAAHYNHQTKHVGYRGILGAYFSENWKLSLEPFYENQSKGLQCSLGFHFGGAKSRENQPLTKSHRFFYSSYAKAKTTSHPPVVRPSIAPSPIKEPVAFPFPVPFSPVVPMPSSEFEVIQAEQVIKDDSKPEPGEVEKVIKDDPKPNRDWVDYLFFWRAGN